MGTLLHKLNPTTIKTFEILISRAPLVVHNMNNIQFNRIQSNSIQFISMEITNTYKTQKLDEMQLKTNVAPHLQSVYSRFQ